MCPKTSPDITQTLRRLDDLYAFLSFFFFLSILASIMVKTMIRERCPASPEAGWRCESEVS